MGTFKTPQEKKRLSYQHDHRDDYNESNKGSRKAVRWRKRWVNQTYRHNIRQVLSTWFDKSDTDIVENKVDEVRRPLWRKSSHRPLGLYLYGRGRLAKTRIEKLTFHVSDQRPMETTYQYGRLDERTGQYSITNRPGGPSI